jgi:2-dehydro-3-deoxygluconokinase
VLETDLDVLFSLIAALKAAGGKLAFDGNYRPRLWQGRETRAREIFAKVTAQADLLLPTFEDEQMLWGDRTPGETVARLRALGSATAVLKLGAEGCLIATPDGTTNSVPVPEKITPLDTTAAGDSFNAGLLAAWLQGQSLERAALAGHDLASRVIRHRGAILPKSFA